MSSSALVISRLTYLAGRPPRRRAEDSGEVVQRGNDPIGGQFELVQRRERREAEDQVPRTRLDEAVEPLNAAAGVAAEVTLDFAHHIEGDPVVLLDVERGFSFRSIRVLVDIHGEIRRRYDRRGVTP